MTVIVTKKPGGITQLFNPETGKITYKSKEDQAFLKIDAFDGIVKFNQKGAKAIVEGPKTSLEDCDVIKEGEPEYGEALKKVRQSEISFKEADVEKLSKEISDLASRL